MAGPEHHAIRATPDPTLGAERERIHALYSATLVGVLAEALAAAAVIAAAHSIASPQAVWGWLGCVAAAVFVRLALVIQYRPQSASGALPLRWERWLGTASIAAGIAWGALVPAFGPFHDPLSDGLLVLLTGVVTVLALESLHASRRAMLGFAVPALVIPAAALAFTGSGVGIALAALLLALLAVLANVFRRRHDLLVDALRARARNDQLEADLARADFDAAEARREERMVFESALVGIAIVRDWRIIRCNRKLEEIFGWRRGTLAGASTRVLYRNEAEWREATEYIDVDLANSGEHDAEREFRRRDEREIWCRLRAQPMDRADPAVGAIWVFEDLTEAKLAAEEMLKSEEQLAVADEQTRSANARLGDAIESFGAAFALFDAGDRLVACNQLYLDDVPGRPTRDALLGASYEELLMRVVKAREQVPADYQSDRDLPRWVEEMMVRHRNPGDTDFTYQTRAGRWLQLRERRTSDGGIVMLRSDVTELKRLEEEARHLAHHDPLTGLPNRRLLEDRMSQAFALARRQNHMVAVMLIDLDKFKQVNDTAGHEAGDAVLKEVAARLKKATRQTDTIARQGGDEFVVVAGDIKREQNAAQIADKIIRALAKPVAVGGVRHEIGASIGIALFPANGKDAESLLKLADAAMYRAKSGGRGRYEFVAPPAAPAQSELGFD